MAPLSVHRWIFERHNLRHPLFLSEPTTKIFYVFLPDNYYTHHLKKKQKKKTVTLTAVVNVEYKSDKISSLCGDDGHSDDGSDDS